MGKNKKKKNRQPQNVAAKQLQDVEAVNGAVNNTCADVNSVNSHAADELSCLNADAQVGAKYGSKRSKADGEGDASTKHFAIKSTEKEDGEGESSEISIQEGRSPRSMEDAFAGLETGSKCAAPKEREQKNIFTYAQISSKKNKRVEKQAKSEARCEASASENKHINSASSVASDCASAQVEKPVQVKKVSSQISGANEKAGGEISSKMTTLTECEESTLQMRGIIPTRKNISKAGTKGRRTKVETNHLALDLHNLRTKTAIHYDVSIEPEKPKRLLRSVMEEFRNKNFPQRFPAYDGRKNLLSASPLPFIDYIHDTIKVYDPEVSKEKEFEVMIKFACQVDLTSLNQYMRRGTSLDAPQTALQVLDIVLRTAPALAFVPVGRSYFTPPQGKVEDLGDGYEMWYGLFQSVNLGWRPFVNVDVVHKGFPTAQSVLGLLPDICSHGREPQLDLRKELTPYQRHDFQRFIKGLKVDYQIPNQIKSRRTFKVNCVVDAADTLSFSRENGEITTIQDYFSKEKKFPLKYPHLPCLHVGSLKRETPIYLPIEFCTISAGQITQRKMSENQTLNMLHRAATSSTERKKKIQEALKKAKFNDTPQVKEFGLTVSDSFEQVEARILSPPTLGYADKHTEPERGVWQAKKLLKGKTLKNWNVLILDNGINNDDVNDFTTKFISQGNSLGMIIQRPQSLRKIDIKMKKSKEELETFFRGCKGFELVIVIVSDKKDIYTLVKQTAELTVGILTQCIKSRTLHKMTCSTAQNIILKVNSKLNGINHIMHHRPACLTKPAMIVGADVTHPSPDQLRSPSVAAVCSSHDPSGFQYNIQFRLQPPRMEIIEDLQNIMQVHLLYFYKKTNYKPHHILFYRDGVSEGQFDQVLHTELQAIRNACSSMQKEPYTPSITFLVVQKRHHTRFFPLKREDSDGKNENVLPGTIVDTIITHPTEIDFYLVSHASLQGVSRPTKYRCLWNDSNMSEDELEELTYFLCHMFSRCTRSISYPAPTYYAHLAAYRARVYIDGCDETHKQYKLMRSNTIGQFISQSPMYFV